MPIRKSNKGVRARKPSARVIRLGAFRAKQALQRFVFLMAPDKFILSGPYSLKGKAMRLKVLMSLAILGCMTLAGCTHTVEGAGEDISRAGQSISKSVK